MKRLLWSVMTGCVLMLAAGGATAQSDADAAALARADVAAADFQARLRQALQARMTAEGPLSALAFCHEQAPLIASAVMDKHGVRLGRVAIPGRERNPGNSARPWQLPWLERFASAVAAGQKAQDQVAVIRDDLPDGVVLRLLRGIAVEAPCQLCHGRELAPEIASELARLYPEDRASGFVEGDLRGALWVDVPPLPIQEQADEQ